VLVSKAWFKEVLQAGVHPETAVMPAICAMLKFQSENNWRIPAFKMFAGLNAEHMIPFVKGHRPLNGLRIEKILFGHFIFFKRYQVFFQQSCKIIELSYPDGFGILQQLCWRWQ
jgi:hypothetical protein